jgi:dolichol-phosphate mannosyltransferase
LLFVDDGSTDGSRELIQSSGYTCLNLGKHMGVGYTYISALDWALVRGYELFVTIASNGKMLPAEMKRVMDPVQKNEADYVTGSRFMEGGFSPNLPNFRRYSIPLVNHFIRMLTGVRLTDASCGYRAFRLDIMRRAEFDWHRPWMYTYGFEYYLYAKALLDKTIRCKEVPVTMRYPSKGREYSKIRPFIDWYAMLKPWVIARIDGKGFQKSK